MRRSILQVSYIIAPILILAVLSSWSGIPSTPLPTTDLTFAVPTSPQPYVTLLPKVPASSLSPFLIYPTNTTIWVASVSSPGNPAESQLRQYFIDGTSIGVLNLTNVIVSSIVADPSNRSSRIWFTENSTLSLYDSTLSEQTKAISFPGQSLQYLTNDPQGRIWISMASSSGRSTIAVYDPVSHTNQTYAVPTIGAIIQGITVAPGNTIWFAEAGSRKIGRLVPGVSPVFSEFSPPPSISLAAPVQLAVDASGNVWFTDHGSNQFGVFDPQASTWKAFPIGYCLNNCVSGLPNAIFLDAKNTIWFSEHVAGRIAHYDPSTGLLTEYSVPGSNAPYTWWAMPGPKNLVWFVALALGQIGYVNASIPVATGLSHAISELTVQRGSFQRVPITVSSASQEKFSLNSSEVTQDAPPFNPPQIYSSSQSGVVPGENPYSTNIMIFAAWNATFGQRYVALTAFDSKVSLSVFVRVNVIDSSISYVAVGSVSMIILGSLIIFVNRRRRPNAKSVARLRK